MLKQNVAIGIYTLFAPNLNTNIAIKNIIKDIPPYITPATPQIIEIIAKIIIGARFFAIVKNTNISVITMIKTLPINKIFFQSLIICFALSFNPVLRSIFAKIDKMTLLPLHQTLPLNMKIQKNQ